MIGDNAMPALLSEYEEAMAIFPALHEYKKSHTTVNLQKLMVEVSDFCRSIYASTTNDEERVVFKKTLDKLVNL
jgi:hypothetical protein